jgi:hypothetical protein
MIQRVLLFLLVSCLALTHAVQADEPSPNLKDALLKAIRLPLVAEMAREADVNADGLKAALTAALAKRIPAGDMTDVLDASVESSDKHGPIDNFGAFVQSRLDEGLRGRDLADAIRREHAAHGKGKPDRDKRKKSKGDK